MPLPPRIVWTSADNTHRLVMVEYPDKSQPNEFYLELKNGQPDAMGHEHWMPTEITHAIFDDIMQAVVWP